MGKREFTACVVTAKGTEAVIVKEWTVFRATEKLLKMGYLKVVWVI